LTLLLQFVKISGHSAKNGTRDAYHSPGHFINAFFVKIHQELVILQSRVEANAGGRRRGAGNRSAALEPGLGVEVEGKYRPLRSQRGRVMLRSIIGLHSIRRGADVLLTVWHQ
jgi:hypothetical protein